MTPERILELAERAANGSAYAEAQLSTLLRNNAAALARVAIAARELLCSVKIDLQDPADQKYADLLDALLELDKKGA
jgi:hypothetical protein